jgi:hypothetical protein
MNQSCADEGNNDQMMTIQKEEETDIEDACFFNCSYVEDQVMVEVQHEEEVKRRDEAEKDWKDSQEVLSAEARVDFDGTCSLLDADLE